MNQKNKTIIKNILSKQILNSTSNYVKVNSNKTSFANFTIRNLDNLIIKLNLNTNHTKQIIIQVKVAKIKMHIYYLNIILIIKLIILFI